MPRRHPRDRCRQRDAAAAGGIHPVELGRREHYGVRPHLQREQGVDEVGEQPAAVLEEGGLQPVEQDCRPRRVERRRQRDPPPHGIERPVAEEVVERPPSDRTVGLESDLSGQAHRAHPRQRLPGRQQDRRDLAPPRVQRARDRPVLVDVVSEGHDVAVGRDVQGALRGQQRDGALVGGLGQRTEGAQQPLLAQRAQRRVARRMPRRLGRAASGPGLHQVEFGGCTGDRRVARHLVNEEEVPVEVGEALSRHQVAEVRERLGEEGEVLVVGDADGPRRGVSQQGQV